MRPNKLQSGLAWVEILVVVSILALIASFVLRLRYGQAWLAAEYPFVQSLGISRDVYDLAKISVLCIALLSYVVYRLRCVRRVEVVGGFV
jgi:hypothetical protein